MKHRWLQGIGFLSLLLSPCLAPPASAIHPPPIYNTQGEDDVGRYYVGLDCVMAYQAPWKYYLNSCGPSFTGCAIQLCSTFGAFGSWYYQGCLLDDEGVPSYGGLDILDAPLYGGLDGWEARYDGFSDPIAHVEATLEPFEGLDALRYIPLEVPRPDRPPVAAARYWIKIDDPGAPRTRALFWLTAIYDSSVFDVTYSGWTYALWEFYDGPPRHFLGLDLPSGLPMVFADELLPPSWYSPGGFTRISFMPLRPDYIVIRLKDGCRLEDLGGRKVELMLHTLSWRGGDDVDPYEEFDWQYCVSPPGDAFHYACTSRVMVGADLEGQTNDWFIAPPDLKDECIPPSFSKADDKAAEADIIGTRVIRDLNVSLPSMEAGLARCKVGRTLSTTLGNTAYWYLAHPRDGRVFGELERYPPRPKSTGEFIAVNMHGVWCSLSKLKEYNDLPGWQYKIESNVDRGWLLRVFDVQSRLEYIYAYAGGTYSYRFLLAEVDRFENINDPVNLSSSDPDLLRSYVYDLLDLDGDGIDALELIFQVDSLGNAIDYFYDPIDGAHLTLVGNSQRTISTAFGPPVDPDNLGSSPLISCSNGSGGNWRKYEWYPPSTPATAYDGKLKAILDAADHVLEAFEYDSQGRLISRIRGNAPQTQPVATYSYSAPSTQPSDPLAGSTMDARFYVDGDDIGGRNQLVRRTLNTRGQVTKIEEYHDLQTGDGETGAKSETDIDYCDPPDGLDIPDNLFYETPAFCSRMIGRCVVKTLPPNHGSHRIAEYTQYAADYGFNVTQTFLAPPPLSHPTNGLTEPPPEQRYNWMDSSYGSFPWGYQKRAQVDKSRADTTIGYDYWDGGALWMQTDPLVTGVDGKRVQMIQTWDYWPLDPDHPVVFDYRKVAKHTRSGPSGTIVTEFDYEDDSGNIIDSPTYKVEHNQAAPTVARAWIYKYNAFGQKTLEIDPDAYCHETDYATDTGLLSSTCTYAVCGIASGPVLQQTKYEYENGMLKKIRVADSPVPFPKDLPDTWEGWIVTTYTYDTYGRLTDKTVKDPGTGGDLVSHYDYDRQDRLVKITWPDGRSKEITRNGRGQIVQIDYHGTGQETLTSTYTYDDAGNLRQRTTQGCSDCGSLTEYEYDEYNRRIKETRKGS
jgi:YD repeat-containing protein